MISIYLVYGRDIDLLASGPDVETVIARARNAIAASGKAVEYMKAHAEPIIVDGDEKEVVPWEMLHEQTADA